MSERDGTPEDKLPDATDESDPAPAPAPVPPPSTPTVGDPSSRPRLFISAFAPGGWGRRLAKLWGFLGFCVLVLLLARQVVLPFIFALLLAYILAPVIRRLSVKKDGSRRMPRAVGIILCYAVILSVVAAFMLLLLPRLTRDIGRVGAEAPAMYEKLNDIWVPELAGWIRERFPSADPPPPKLAQNWAPDVTDSLVPPDTQILVTPLADGRLAISLQPTGVEVRPQKDGSFILAPSKKATVELNLEDKLRAQTRGLLSGLQTQIGSVFRFGQAVIRALIKSIFTSVLVLMVAAFILIDLGRINRFVRGLVPLGNRDDYDIIVVGVDKGLSGVIRGQLVICLVNGALTWIGLMIFGIKYALLLASVAAVLSLIPIFGSILSTIPIVLTALVSNQSGLDITTAFFILLWVIGIHLVEANLLNPRIIGTAARMHPVLVIFALVVGEHAYGLTGALLAVPAASIIQVLFIFFRDKAWRVGVATDPKISGT